MLEMSPILHGPSVRAETLVKFVQAKNKQVAMLERIADAYTVYGNLTTIGNVMPFAQAIHETGWFSSRRWLENNNPAGIGATNDGAEGHIWTNPEQGIMAQYAHLLAYSVPINAATHQQKFLSQVSPRYIVLEKKALRGSSPNWIDLNGKWAFPGTTYAQRIASIGESILEFDKRI